MSDPDAGPDDWTGWRIVAEDNLERIELLQARMGRRFPPSFLDLVSRFSFPAFEHGPLMLFANHRDETFWDLSRRLFLDPFMSPTLLSAGFVQIGNPMFYDYDPVCFDCNLGATEPRLVQLDHEAILCNSEIRIVREIDCAVVHRHFEGRCRVAARATLLLNGVAETTEAGVTSPTGSTDSSTLWAEGRIVGLNRAYAELLWLDGGVAARPRGERQLDA